MRFGLCIAAALVLPACDSGAVPTPTERLNQNAATRAQPLATDMVKLNGRGLIAGGKELYFSADITEVRSALGDILGADGGIVTNSECGAGLIQSAQFSGGLKVNFENDTMVGWSIDQSADTEATRIKVTGDVQVGTPRAAAEAASGFAALADSSLGEEFALGAAIGGFIEQDKVSMLYAGTQCFFR